MKLGIMPIITQQSQRCLSLETSNKSKSQYQSRCKSKQLAFGSGDLNLWGAVVGVIIAYVGIGGFLAQDANKLKRTLQQEVQRKARPRVSICKKYRIK